MSNNGITIDRTDVMKLYQGILSSLSPESLNQWLKATTDNEYIVIPTKSLKEITDKWL